MVALACTITIWLSFNFIKSILTVGSIFFFPTHPSPPAKNYTISPQMNPVFGPVWEGCLYILSRKQVFALKYFTFGKQS